MSVRYDPPVPSGRWRRSDDEEFGARIKAARAYAEMSQGALALRIEELFPAMSVSVRTLKRLESGDSSVKGTRREWAVWVGESTAVPIWFIERGWKGAADEVAADFGRAELLLLLARVLEAVPTADMQRKCLEETKLALADQELSNPDEAISRLRDQGNREYEASRQRAAAHKWRDRERIRIIQRHGELDVSGLEVRPYLPDVGYVQDLAPPDPHIFGPRDLALGTSPSGFLSSDIRSALAEGGVEDAELATKILTAATKAFALQAAYSEGHFREELGQLRAATGAEEDERQQLEMHRRLLEVIVDDHPAVAKRLGIAAAESDHPLHDIKRLGEELTKEIPAPRERTRRKK